MTQSPEPVAPPAGESDGEMLNRLGDDGMAWATEFCKRFPSVAVDDALGWFCNAIETAHDRRTRQAYPAPQADEPIAPPSKKFANIMLRKIRNE